MKLSEKARKYFDDLYCEKQDEISEKYRKEEKGFEWKVLQDRMVGQPQYLFDLFDSWIKEYVRESIEAKIESYIETYELAKTYPDEEDFDVFAKECYQITERLLKRFPSEYFKSPYSPFPKGVDIDHMIEKVEIETRQIPAILFSRVQKFMSQGAYLAELRGQNSSQPESSPVSLQSVTNNNLTVLGNLTGAAQVGTNQSTQQTQVSGSQVSEDEIVTKIHDWLKAREIDFKGELIEFSDIARDTGLSKIQVRQYIDFAVHGLHLNIHTKHLESAYICFIF